MSLKGDKLQRPSGCTEEEDVVAQTRQIAIDQQIRKPTFVPDDKARDRRMVITYDCHKKQCIVSRPTKTHLAHMGYPLRGGSHFLHPEEALYLLEHGCAQIKMGERSLSIEECYYHLLEANGVSWAQYCVYIKLRMLGYLAIRYGQNAGKYFSLEEHRASNSQSTSGRNHQKQQQLRRKQQQGEAEPFRQGQLYNDDNEAKRQKFVEHLPESLSNQQSASDSQSLIAESTAQVQQARFPKSLLDCFPDTQCSSVVSVPKIGNYSTTVGPIVEDSDNHQIGSVSFIDSASFTVKPPQFRKLKDKRKIASSPWLLLRPRYWRYLPESVLCADSWLDFVRMRDLYLNSCSRRLPRPVKDLDVVGSQATIHPVDQKTSSPYRLYYDVYSADMTKVYSHKLPPLPTHRLCIVDIRTTPPPLPDDLLYLRAQSNDTIPIHIAVFDSGQVCFLECNTTQRVSTVI